MTMSKFAWHIQKRQTRRVQNLKKQLDKIISEGLISHFFKDDVLDVGKRRIVNIQTGLASTDVPSKRYVDLLAAYYTDLKNWEGSTINGYGKRLINFSEPKDPNDVATNKFVQDKALCITKSDKYDAKCKRISNVSDPKDPHDVVTLSYLNKILRT